MQTYTDIIVIVKEIGNKCYVFNNSFAEVILNTTTYMVNYFRKIFLSILFYKKLFTFFILVQAC